MTKKIIHTIAFALTIMAGTVGCKRPTQEQKPRQLKDITATIVNAGAVAADGCGYLFVIDDVQYHADNFEGNNTYDNKKVKIDADITDQRYRCGYVDRESQGMPGIAVIHITKMVTL